MPTTDQLPPPVPARDLGGPFLHRLLAGVLGLAPLAASACDDANPRPSASEPTRPEDAVQAAEGSAAGPESESSSQKSDAVAELGTLDYRRPLPLQPMMAWHQKQNMMEHLVAIRQITQGLAEDDWEAITAASATLGSSPQMLQMCEHMGAGAEGFTELALEFHQRADAIGRAAEARDSAEVLRATSHTLEACTSCHATYRQDVVDATTWEARTSSAHRPSMHGTPPHSSR